MKGCGQFIRMCDDYGWIDCGDKLSENETREGIDNGKIELCTECSGLKGKKTDENSGLNSQKQLNTKGKLRDSKVKGFRYKCNCLWSKDDEYGFIPNADCPVHGKKVKEIIKRVRLSLSSPKTHGGKK